MYGLGLSKQIKGELKNIWIFLNKPWQHALVTRLSL